MHWLAQIMKLIPKDGIAFSCGRLPPVDCTALGEKVKGLGVEVPTAVYRVVAAVLARTVTPTGVSTVAILPLAIAGWLWVGIWPR